MANVKIHTIDKHFYQELGKEISNVRHKRGYSLRYLAELTGISKTMLDFYELGKCKIKPETYKKICKSLKIPEKIDIKIELG